MLQYRFNRVAVVALFVATLCVMAFGCAQTAPQTADGKSSGEGLLERALKGEARIIDLSHPLGPNTPAYGGERDAFRYEKLGDMERDGYAAGAFRVPEHFGTHVDSPGHFLKGRETVDRIEAERLIVPAAVIDVRAKVGANPDYRITAEEIREWEREGVVPEGAAVLLLTGWAERYADANSYRNADEAGVLHFPGFSEEAKSGRARHRYLVHRLWSLERLFRP